MNHTTATQPTIADFLGTDARPRWRRWMKYWLPALVVLLGVAWYFNRSDDGKKEYISEAGTEPSLDLTVTDS